MLLTQHRFYILIIMSNQEEETLIGYLDTYLQRSDKVTKQEVTQIIKIAQNYAKNSLNHRFIKLVFASLKKHLKKDNFSNTSKRFLILLDQLLQLSANVAIFKGYAAEVSRGIVDIYLFVFTMIFQYQILQSAVDWKVYRMLWAKIISDDTFDSMRAKVAQKFRNFDLNRGFATENIERIKKRYTRKGFSQNEINRYLDSNRYEPKKVNVSDSAQAQIGLQQEKKRQMEPFRSSVSPGSLSQYPFQKQSIPKPSQNPYEKMIYVNPYEEKINNAHLYGNNYDPYYNTQNLVKQGYAVYNQKPQMIPPGYGYTSGYYNPISNYPTHNQNMKMPQNMATRQNYNYPVPLGHNSFTNSTNTQSNVHVQQVNYYNPSLPPNNVFLTPNIFKNNSNLVIPNVGINPPKLIPQQQQVRKTNSKDGYGYENYKQPKQEREGAKIHSQGYKETINEKSNQSEYTKQLRQKITSQLHQCRQCGLFVNSKYFLEEHIHSHLLDAQNEYFRKESESLGQNKGLTQKNINGNLIETQKWINNIEVQKNSKSYQISITMLNKETGKKNCLYHCFFCQEELAVAWCIQLQDWTLKDSIKVKANDELTVSHYNCFNQFNCHSQLTTEESQQ